MLDRLHKFIRTFSSEGRAKPRIVFDENDHRLAAAGLLVHAMNSDGVESPVERRRLASLLKERFSLDDEETRALIAAADMRNREAIDFNAFTDVVKRAYNAEGRKRIIEMMWDMAFADGVLHEFEDNMVWRVAEILEVPATQRILIRKKVAAARGVDATGMGE
ncbi:TerB family tellurite resistance protein [Labrys wisconsinensis]|uniref:Tellurite resistance protein B-like protein n=1 Tax=Labrys wisconsinensis TaxID=425677 RepID=A0ABU0J0Z4_9HYPH|nr:TerB family tellurite resistance protein [Labrys wisconsinensis]MDQ0467934.1 putative tellurite resistance protein B-like protein [Labrys wisconsinensis]